MRTMVLLLASLFISTPSKAQMAPPPLDYVAVPETLHGDFLLRVRGDSMIDAGILDGDIVVVKRQQTAENADIVVALAGEDETAEDATVKRSSTNRDRTPVSRRVRWGT